MKCNWVGCHTAVKINYCYIPHHGSISQTVLCLRRNKEYIHIIPSIFHIFQIWERYAVRNQVSGHHWGKRICSTAGRVQEVVLGAMVIFSLLTWDRRYRSIYSLKISLRNELYTFPARMQIFLEKDIASLILKVALTSSKAMQKVMKLQRYGGRDAGGARGCICHHYIHTQLLCV